MCDSSSRSGVCDAEEDVRATKAVSAAASTKGDAYVHTSVFFITRTADEVEENRAGTMVQSKQPRAGAITHFTFVVVMTGA